ncbi:hypothetical protein PoB_000746700 [Plakobranchus ocellatus]|uniref:Uncharacterized protein n=1 Tax=Plakobranchus ocellatus TaxID=259542 RepID=A0AAV3YFI7_9GAST|nr:hypothetical protein PoB_000746700 [Plakobranchus ocellatus]
MKEALGLTWHHYRERKLLWNKVGICVSGEHKERKIFREEIDLGDTLKLESIKASPVPGTLKEEPVGLVADLNKFTIDLLEKYDGEGKLTWHNGGIPENQMLVKTEGEA